MKSLHLIFAAFLFNLALAPCLAQNVPRGANLVAAEYFVGIDPGPNRATPLTVASPGQSVDVQINTLNLPLYQTLYLRFRDANGKWSSARPFTFTGYGNNRDLNITRAEYFIGLDPGFGNGTAITLTPGINSAFEVPSIALSRGQRVRVRVRDVDGRWSGPVANKYPDEIILRAELSTPRPVAPGAGTPMRATDGSFNSAVEAIEGTLSNWNRTDSIWVRVQSSSYFWSLPVGQGAVLPDLSITATVASNYTSGQTGVQIPVTVTRTGGELTAGTYVDAHLFWSANSVWEPTDTRLWRSNNSTPDFPNSTLNASGSKTVTATLNIPTAPNGTYYIIAVVDSSNFHTESDESNNTKSSALTIGAFQLTFPLRSGPSVDPWSAVITSVMDHSMRAAADKKTIEYDQSDNTVVAFTGEVGNKDSRPVGGTAYFAWSSWTSPSFMVNGNYGNPGGSPTDSHLFYNGHPGYDYSTDRQKLPVYPAAPGIAYRGSTTIGEVYVDHLNGYRTRYVHLDPESRIADSTPVTTQDQLGIADKTGAGEVHLHFEVLRSVDFGGVKVYIPVDPYGWEGQLSGKGDDPYRTDLPGLNVNLWASRPIAWTQRPPPSAVSGSSFAVSWSVTGVSSHTDVHYDMIEDVSKKTCESRTSSCRSSSIRSGSGNFSVAVTAPSVNVPTRYYFAAHATINGKEYYTPLVPVTVTPSATQVERLTDEAPNSFALVQNYPNPFNPSTTIEFALPKSAFVTLRVYDLLGRQVGELVNEKLGPGNYRTQWDASGFASGVYFYRLTAGDFVQTRKLLLLK